MPTDSGIVMRRTRQGDDGDEQRISDFCTVVISDERMSNPLNELTINGLGAFSISSLFSFIEAIGDRTVFITSHQNQRVEYRVISPQAGERDFYWYEGGNSITNSDWTQLFSDPESFPGSSQAAEDAPESFFQRAHEVTNSGNRQVFLVNPLALFFNGQWLERFTQFLLSFNPPTPSYYLPLGILYFRTGWTVHLPENNIIYSVMQLGRVLYLNIINTVPRRLQAVNPGDDNAQSSASGVLRETVL
ncbi:hypothetical protein [Endozoicomonas lisbonensis]|uniref:hypothetical protein n=1 Tax=Endozoicomonas lisbonensis TaxID=3120522 RepID=UPI003396E96F